MVPSPPATRTRLAPLSTAFLILLSISLGSTASSSKPALASASRAASALPLLELRKALTLETVIRAGFVAAIRFCAGEGGRWPSSIYKKDADLDGRRPFRGLLEAAADYAALAPEPGERRAVRRLAKLLERALTDLPDSLAGHAHQGADLLEGHRIRALLETVVQVQDLALARGEVFPEHPVDELAHEMKVGDVFDLTAIDAGEALAEGAGFTIGAVDRSVERDLRCRHLLGGPN